MIGDDTIRKLRIHPLVRTVFLLLLLYLFFVSISLLSASFKFLGEGFAEQLLETTSNPFIGLFIGILATSLVQSSSTVTSMTVGLVAGGAINVYSAIPIVMGSNIGTSVTNTIVSVGHIYRKDEFERAFAAATVHDSFNLCAVVILLPLQLSTNILGAGSGLLSNILKEAGGLEIIDPLKIACEPTVNLIAHITGKSGLFMLIIAAVFLFFALRYLVTNLKALVIGKIEAFFDKTLFRNAANALSMGLIFTLIVQSSSITTSLAVPLAGAGILTIRQIFPYTLGANIGTTLTAMLASLCTGSEAAVQVAFAHLLFNILGIIIIWPIKTVPIFLAKTLGKKSSENKIFPFAYVGIIFFLIPTLLIFLMR